MILPSGANRHISVTIRSTDMRSLGSRQTLSGCLNGYSPMNSVTTWTINASTITQDILDPPSGNEPHYCDQGIDGDRQPRADKCQHDTRDVEHQRCLAFNVAAECVGKYGIRPLLSH